MEYLILLIYKIYDFHEYYCILKIRPQDKTSVEREIIIVVGLLNSSYDKNDTCIPITYYIILYTCIRPL